MAFDLSSYHQLRRKERLAKAVAWKSPGPRAEIKGTVRTLLAIGAKFDHEFAWCLKVK